MATEEADTRTKRQPLSGPRVLAIFRTVCGENDRRPVAFIKGILFQEDTERDQWRPIYSLNFLEWKLTSEEWKYFYSKQENITRKIGTLYASFEPVDSEFDEECCQMTRWSLFFE